jgi:hypothetical protein
MILTFVGLHVELELVGLREGLSTHAAHGRPFLRVRPPHVTVMRRVRGERFAAMLALQKRA